MPVQGIQYDRDAFFSGFTLQEMVYEVQSWLGQVQGDYNRYSEKRIVEALNLGQSRFAKLTDCLIFPVVLIGKNGRQNYRLPYSAIKVLNARYYTSSDRTGYQELEILKTSDQMQIRDNNYRGTLGDPNYLFPTYRSGAILTVGVAPIPSQDGEIFSNVTNTGVMETSTGFEAVGNITGTHSGAYSNSAFLVDSLGRDLTVLGALVGYPVYNQTTGESGVITAITTTIETNDTAVATLSNSGVWSPGDTFNIPMGEYGVVLDVGTEQEAFTMSSYFGNIGDIVGGQGNFGLDCSRRPLPFALTDAGQIYMPDVICEIPEYHQEAVIAYAVYWLGRGSGKGLMQEKKSKEAAEIFSNHVAEFTETELVEPTEHCVEALDYFS